MNYKDNIKKINDKLDLVYETAYDKGYQTGYGESYDKGFDKGFIDGKQAEYDKFWDIVQENGKRENYQSVFCQNAWKDEMFYPKYDFVPTRANAMFQYSSLTTLASKLKQQGIKLDTSKLTGTLAIQMFQGSNIKDIPEMDLRNCINIGYIFGSNAKVETIEKFIISEQANTGLGTCFMQAYDLKHCIFDGVLAITGMDLHWSTLLDKESIISLVNILSTTTSGLTVTLSLQAVNKAFETSENAKDGSNSTEWQTLVNTKQNWTINLS